uniref:BHLH domain-containing protein n=1 Tax=Ciona intestinalis TaxID=7719 RepID=F7B554_CIOIN
MPKSPVKKTRRRKRAANSQASGQAKSSYTVRPNAAIRERERLKVFNDSLEALQKVIPINLPEGRKLHKKQTLQLACRYIRFLKDVLDDKRDWGERRRFWCGSDADINMIEAIDAAAIKNTQTPTKNPKIERTPRKTHNHQTTTNIQRTNTSYATPVHYTNAMFKRKPISLPPILPQISDVYSMGCRQRDTYPDISNMVTSHDKMTSRVEMTSHMKLVHSEELENQSENSAIKTEMTEEFPATKRDDWDVWPDLIDIISKPET